MGLNLKSFSKEDYEKCEKIISKKTNCDFKIKVNNLSSISFYIHCPKCNRDSVKTLNSHLTYGNIPHKIIQYFTAYDSCCKYCQAEKRVSQTRHGEKFLTDKLHSMRNYINPLVEKGTVVTIRSDIVFHCTKCDLKFKSNFWYMNTFNYGCPRCDLTHSSLTKEILIDRIKKKYKTISPEPLYNLEPFHKFNSLSDEIEVKCKICNKIFKLLVTDVCHKGTRGKADAGCFECTKDARASSDELELREFIKSLYNKEIKYNCYGVVGGREVDIYLPELKLAIEYNGAYWHNNERLESQQKGKGKTYHLFKTKEAEKRGIKLVHIFDDEWWSHKDQVKKLLKRYITEPNSTKLPLFFITKNKNYLEFPRTKFSVLDFQKWELPYFITSPKLLENGCYDSGSIVLEDIRTR